MHHNVHDAFVDRLAEAAEAQPAGDPAEPETVVGPSITPEARDRVAASVEASIEAGLAV